MENRKLHKVSDTQQGLLKSYALAVLIMSLLINMLSAYIRHIEAGLGCENWPACYAQIGDFVSPTDGIDITQRALAPTESAKRIHRTMATILVVVALLLVNQSRKPGAIQGANNMLPYLLLAVLLLLSIIGPASYLKTMPVIALINLTGGIALLAISGLLWLQLQCRSTNNSPAPLWIKRLVFSGLFLLLCQILLGAWVSANFAGLACNELLSCKPDPEYSAQGNNSFWYFRELTLNNQGRVIFDSSAVHIHLTHRLGAVISALVLLAGAFLARPYQSKAALSVVFLVILQVMAGIAGILWSLPIVIVLSHNLLATLLLLASLTLYYQLIPREVNS